MFSYDAPPTTDLTLDFEVRLKITVSWRINQGFKSWGNNFVFITLALKEGQRSGTQTLWKSVSNNWWGKTSFSATKTSTHNSKLDIQLKLTLKTLKPSGHLGDRDGKGPLALPYYHMPSVMDLACLTFQEPLSHVASSFLGESSARSTYML